MKTTVSTYSNEIGSIVQYAVRDWTINVFAAERFVLESKLSEEQKKQLSQPGVYLLVNNEQVYVGQSTNILDRWNQHINTPEKDWFDCAYAITDVKSLMQQI